MLLTNNTQVTDAGLVHLVGLRRCMEVVADDTKVTLAGIAAMKAKCP
jgi:hypothetical protein